MFRLAALLLLTACGAPSTGPADAGHRDAARDGGPGPDGGTVCPAGQHACGAGCIDDLADDPAVGCRLGCGEPCPTPTSGTSSCSAEGRCDFECAAPYHREGNDCVCAARTCASMMYECGAPDDGCGHVLDCGTCALGVCLSGLCSCMPDAHEVDDTAAIAPTLGTYDDSTNPPPVTLTDYNLHTAADVDWTGYTIIDGADLGNPDITVTLSGVRADSAYQLSAFYVCNNGTDATTCAAGAADAEIGAGCTAAPGTTSTVHLTTDCNYLGLDDSGRLLVRVRASSWGALACDPYHLTVEIH